MNLFHLLFWQLMNCLNLDTHIFTIYKIMLNNQFNDFLYFLKLFKCGICQKSPLIFKRAPHPIFFFLSLYHFYSSFGEFFSSLFSIFYMLFLTSLIMLLIFKCSLNAALKIISHPPCFTDALCSFIFLGILMILFLCFGVFFLPHPSVQCKKLRFFQVSFFFFSPSSLYHKHYRLSSNC